MLDFAFIQTKSYFSIHILASVSNNIPYTHIFLTVKIFWNHWEREKLKYIDFRIKTHTHTHTHTFRHTPWFLLGKLRILTDNGYRLPSARAHQVMDFHYTCKQKLKPNIKFSSLLLKGEWMRLNSPTA